MTCIIGLVEKGIVYIGGDSGGSNGWLMRPVKSPKVFKLGDFLIGFTYSWRMGQLLQYNLTVPVKDQGMDDQSYMITVVAETVRKTFKEHGFSTINNNHEAGGCFLIGYHSNLFRVDADFEVLQHEENFEAIGSGSDFALAAMLALKETPPEKRIKQALKIAAHFSMSVCAPFRILRSEP